MKLYAWIGEDEGGSGVVGLKQAHVPAGYIALVCIEQDKQKLLSPSILRAMQMQADVFNKTISFVEFTMSDTVRTLTPRNNPMNS